VLYEILNHQRAPYDRMGIGYSNKTEDVNEEASTSSKKPREERNQSYVALLEIQSNLKTTEGKNNMIVGPWL
jgi:hypothetical protein